MNRRDGSHIHVPLNGGILKNLIKLSSNLPERILNESCKNRFL